ncbi:ribonuclease III, partial [Fischerella thermalis CCMEE 5330]
QAQFKVLPEYRVVEISQPHNNQERFIAQVWLHGQKFGEGKGRSIKAAEQAAAKVAFLTLSTQENH